MNSSLDSVRQPGRSAEGWWDATWQVGSIRASWRTAGLVAALVSLHVLALVLRLIGLGAEGLWQDEVHTVITLRRPWLELLTEPLSNAQPLYFMFVKLWTEVFGLTETTLRLPSVIAGVLTVGMTYFLAKRLAGVWVALGAALLVAVSPALIWYSQEARTYSVEGLLLVTGLYFLAGFLENGRTRPLALYGLFAVLSLYVHFYSALYLAGVGLGGVLWLLAYRRPRDTTRFVLLNLIVALSLLPRVPIIRHDLGEIDVVGFTQPPLHVMLDLWRFVGLSVPRLDGFGNPVLMAAMWSAVAVSTIVALARRQAMVVAIAAAATAAVLLYMAGTFLGMPTTIRYLIPVLPLLYILAAHGAGLALNRRPLTRVAVAQPLAAAIAVAVLAWGFVASDNLHASPTKEDWRGLVQHVQANVRPGDLINVYPTRMDRNVEFYLGGSTVGLPARDFPQACSKPRRIWLVTQLTSEPSGPMLALGKTCALVESRSFYPYLTVFLFAPPGPGQQPMASTLTCQGKEPTIIGTLQDDRIVGTNGPDVIVSLDGNDTVYGQGGDDTVCGGAGDDALYGGDGNDALDGGDGGDSLYGANGADQISGGAGDDMLSGGPNDDFLDGGQGKNDLNGGPGTDSCRSGKSDALIACEKALSPATPFG